MKIENTTCNKLALYPAEHFGPLTRGYGGQRGKPISIVIHSTNGRKGSTFDGEVNFIYKSHDISAHYLVGKDGRVAQFVPDDWMAYHAGSIFPQYHAYGNYGSIGIETHFTPGEVWPQEGENALIDLCKYLCTKYGIKLIETHRKIAKPVGRKQDPSQYTDLQFYTLRERILSDTIPSYRVHVAIARIRSLPSTKAPIIGRVSQGTTLSITHVVTGENYLGNARWCQLADRPGYIWEGLLQLA